MDLRREFRFLNIEMTKHMDDRTRFSYLSASSEGSGESVHRRRLTRAFCCSHTQSMNVDEDSTQNLDLRLCWKHQYGCLLEEFVQDTKILCAGLYSKTCVKRPLKNRHNKDLNDKW